MQTGNMKFANLASALEELNKALENSHTIDEKIVLSKEDYEKLTAIGGGDERECIRKAIMAFIGEGDLPDSVEVSPIKADFPDAGIEIPAKKKAFIKCAKCKIPFEIQTDENMTDENPVEVQCPNCNARGYVKPQG